MEIETKENEKVVVNVWSNSILHNTTQHNTTQHTTHNTQHTTHTHSFLSHFSTTQQQNIKQIEVMSLNKRKSSHNTTVDDISSLPDIVSLEPHSLKQFNKQQLRTYLIHYGLYFIFFISRFFCFVLCCVVLFCIERNQILFVCLFVCLCGLFFCFSFVFLFSTKLKS
jgi:hypothetical protein